MFIAGCFNSETLNLLVLSKDTDQGIGMKTHFLKGLCHAILIFFLKIPKMSCSELNSKNNGLGFFFKTIL